MLFIFAALISIVSSSSSGAAAPVAAESAWDAAIVFRDAAALATILADNFVGLNEDGTYEDKAQTLRDFRRVKVIPIRNYVSSRKVHRSGDSAIITGIYTEEGRVSIADSRRYRLVVRYADTYIRVNGSWKAIQGFGKTLSSRILK